MSILGDCLLSLPLIHDSGSIAGCFQAEGTLESANIISQSTIDAASRTLDGAKIALAGEIFVICQPFIAHQLSERAKRKRIAATYLAEMESLHVFLRTCHVTRKLQISAKAKKNSTFTSVITG